MVNNLFNSSVYSTNICIYCQMRLCRVPADEESLPAGYWIQAFDSVCVPAINVLAHGTVTINSTAVYIFGHAKYLSSPKIGGNQSRNNRH